MPELPKESPWVYVFGTALLVGIVGLIGAVGGTIQALLDRSRGDATPHPITLDNLLANGPGANRHITVTGFRVGANYVMKSEIAAEKNETYLVASPHGVAPGTPNRTLVVHVTKFQDYTTATTNPEQASFTGMYSPDEFIGVEQKRMLSEKYPGVNWDNTPYLEVRPYRGDQFGRAAVFAGFGVPLTAGSIAAFVIRSRRPAPPPAPAKKKRKQEPT